MRPILFIILLSSVAFAQSAPPIKEVMGNNTLMASSLDNRYNATLADTGTVPLRFAHNTIPLDVSASVEIAGITLLLDNLTYPADGLAILVSRGQRQEHLMSRSAEGYPDFACDRYFFEHMTDENAWRCDFEPDYCAEFENSSRVLYDLNATFSFSNRTETVKFNSTLVPVPDSILAEMKNSSGADVLNVSVLGSVLFVYEINDRGFGVSDCGSNYVSFNASIPVSANRSFQVAGANRLFFLTAPVLGEQWFRNNRFNLIVLSQSPIYHAETSLNGNFLRNFSIRNFSVVAGPGGIQQIVSTLNVNDSGWSEAKNLTAPAPLQEQNRSFAFIYEFNTTYEGLGRNNLSISINDSFLGYDQFNMSILSRMLSYAGNITEEGTPARPETSRSSVAFKSGSISPVQVLLGLVAFLLFLAFLNFWIKK